MREMLAQITCFSQRSAHYNGEAATSPVYVTDFASRTAHCAYELFIALGINQAGLLTYTALVLYRSGFSVMRATISTHEGHISDTFELSTNSNESEHRLLRSPWHYLAVFQSELAVPCSIGIHSPPLRQVPSGFKYSLHKKACWKRIRGKSILGGHQWCSCSA